jgi:pimeloyl-ACP methyl ester carboxylesterase
VLEPGAGQTSSDLTLITSAVAPRTRVCVYDRAGRGRSDPTTDPQDAARIAADLRTLLRRADEPGPFVLAGHSFGGLYALTFAARYPDASAGLVLVDSTAPDAEGDPAHRAGEESDVLTQRISALAVSSARLGMGRVAGLGSPEELRSTIDEYASANRSVRQAGALRSFADKPLIVLTAGTGTRSGWSASQEALVTLSTNSVHRVIREATHGSLIGDPHDAGMTSQGILDVVGAVRSGTALGGAAAPSPAVQGNGAGRP